MCENNQVDKYELDKNQKDIVAQYTTGSYSKYDPEVISFIIKIMCDTRNIYGNISEFFTSGYSWHFAHMLKNVFKRGDVVMSDPQGHFVWMDIDGCLYDVNGPYDSSETDRLLTEEFLDDIIYDFIHIPDKIYECHNKDFHEWAEFMYMSDAYAITKIWIDMPKDDVCFASMTMEENVINYWVNNQQELQEKYWDIRKKNMIVKMNKSRVITTPKELCFGNFKPDSISCSLCQNYTQCRIDTSKSILERNI